LKLGVAVQCSAAVAATDGTDYKAALRIAENHIDKIERQNDLLERDVEDATRRLYKARQHADDRTVEIVRLKGALLNTFS
jgi:multidrug resistance efflux pump